MPTYISKNNLPDFVGEINEEPSQTIQGEHQEMKDILNYALKGTQWESKKVIYFAPDKIEQINHMFKNNLDLTDLDTLKSNNLFMKREIDKAIQQRNDETAELTAQVEQNVNDNPPEVQ